MERIIGTAAMGLRAPIIKEGDDLVSTVFDVVKKQVIKEILIFVIRT